MNFVLCLCEKRCIQLKTNRQLPLNALNNGYSIGITSFMVHIFNLPQFTNHVKHPNSFMHIVNQPNRKNEKKFN